MNRTPLFRSVRPAAALLALIALSFPNFAAAADDEAATAKAPVRRVVLFNSGVGYFERQGQVTGNATIDLAFDVDDVNDLLKSMVVEDADGGRVATVTYGSRDPIARTLKTFAIDLTEEPTLGQLLKQVRGERVELEAPTPLTGSIIGVERQLKHVGGDQTVEIELLTLLTDEGLRRVPLDSVGRIELARPELDAELRQALETLALGNDTDKKTVTLRCTGEGKRTVRIGYILESPVWKTSYRLVLDNEDKPFLQGWAIVENTTDADWSDVQLSLVSGRPISFVMDLYSPLFAHRPTVTPELYASLTPQLYDQDLSRRREAEDAASGLFGRVAGVAGEARGGGGGYGGFGGAPAAASAAAREQAALEFGESLASSVTSAAQAGDVGELFQYEIDGPVTLARQRSAMLPIVNESIAGRKVSIYNQAVHAQHPLVGVELENTSDLHLMQGPVTVFDGGVYAGDARIPDLPAGGERLLSYAMDLELEVAPTTDADPQTLLTTRIARGTLICTYKQVRTQQYDIKNSADEAKSLLIEHPHPSSQDDWKLVAPAEPTEKTRDAYRFAVEVAADETSEFEIKEQRTLQETVTLASIGPDRVKVLVSAPQTSEDVKDALREVMRRQAEISQLVDQQKRAHGQIATITSEQDRIRNNMHAIPANSDLYNRYMKKFTNQEDEIESLREQSIELDEQITTKRRELEDYIAGLELE